MAVKQVSAESAVSPNLVPMVDIMFLLLLFFMLGADMGQRELEDVRLPVAAHVKEDAKADAARARLTINVFHDEARCAVAAAEGGVCGAGPHWAIGIRGGDFRDAGRLRAKLREEVAADRARRGDDKSSGTSELSVMIRADRAALYSHVQRAMTACGDAGITKVALGAAEKESD